MAQVDENQAGVRDGEVTTFLLMTMQETLAKTACMMRESELKMKHVQT